MISESKDFQGHWVHVLLSILIFLAIIQIYVSDRNQSRYENVNDNISFFVFVVLNPLLFISATYQLFPQKIKGVNMLNYLLANSWKILVPLIFWVYLVAAKNIYSYGFQYPELYVPHFTIGTYGFYTAKTRNSTHLKVWSILAGIAVVYFFAVY